MQQTHLKGVQDSTRLGKKGNLMRLNFDHTTKWYMHKQELILENKTHETLCDFEIQTDHLTSTWRQDLVLINKKIEFTT